jgi:hypothetical protein
MAAGIRGPNNMEPGRDDNMVDNNDRAKASQDFICGSSKSDVLTWPHRGWFGHG